MLKQLFLSGVVATAFAATPVLAKDHTPESEDQGWAQEQNKTHNKTDKKAAKDNHQSAKDGENAPHPAHRMDEGDAAAEQGR